MMVLQSYILSSYSSKFICLLEVDLLRVYQVQMFRMHSLEGHIQMDRMVRDQSLHQGHTFLLVQSIEVRERKVR